MPSWRSPPRTGTGSDCEGATAGGASTSSPSSTIPTSPPTTMAASASSVLPPPTARSPAASAPTGAPTSTPPSAPSSAPPHGAVSTPFRPSAQPYRASPSSHRVEQLLLRRRGPGATSGPAPGDLVFLPHSGVV